MYTRSKIAPTIFLLGEKRLEKPSTLGWVSLSVSFGIVGISLKHEHMLGIIIACIFVEGQKGMKH